MRPRIWTALFAVAISIVSIDQPLSAGAASPMVDPSSSGFTFTDLGPSIWPMHVNNSAVAVGQYVVNGNGQNPAPAMWRNGAVTQLAVPAGSHGSAVVITDAGVAEGGVYNPDTGTSAVVAWPVSGGAASTIATHYGALMGDPTTGTLAVIDSDTGQYSIMSADGRLLQAVGTPHYGPYLEGVGPTTFAWIDHETEQCVLEQTATGARTILDFCAAGIAPDGTVVGATSDSAQAGVLRLPDGTKTALPITSPLYIDANHDVASATQFLAAGASTPVDVATLLPSGWSLSAVHAMSNNGIIVGLARNSNDSFGTSQARVLASFTVSFSRDIISRIAASASRALPRQQMTRSSA